MGKLSKKKKKKREKERGRKKEKERGRKKEAQVQEGRTRRKVNRCSTSLPGVCPHRRALCGVFHSILLCGVLPPHFLVTIRKRRREEEWILKKKKKKRKKKKRKRRPQHPKKVVFITSHIIMKLFFRVRELHRLQPNLPPSCVLQHIFVDG